MKTSSLSLLVISLMLGLALVGCNSTPPSSTPVAAQGNATTLPAQPTSVPTLGNPTPLPAKLTSVPTAPIATKAPIAPAGSGACANPYYPSTLGATWTYANTSPMAPASTTVRTISDVSAAGFITHDAITPDIVVTIKWSCADSNLTMLESATVSAKSIALAISSANATGFLIPAAISAGSKWSEKLDFVGTGAVGKQQMTQQNDTQIACTNVDKENIKVKAGTFDALKVTCVYTIATTTDIGSTPGTPITNTITMTDWYVLGVGSVKTEKTGDIIETHELTSYSVP